MKWQPVALTVIPASSLVGLSVYELQRKHHERPKEPDPGRVIMSPDCITRERVFNDGITLIYE